MRSVSTDERTSPQHLALHRGSVLLSGGSLFAATVTASIAGPSIALAQQQPQPPAVPSGRRPNILVIMGDDIGQSNIEKMRQNFDAAHIR